jgi:TolA-binding protein
LFNAKELFEEANKMELRDNGKPSPQAVSKYNKAMKKCGLVIKEYKDSKYADDALFLLAKCFYYKQNYFQAKEKFSELIKFYPKSEYYADAKIYIAKTHYKLKNHQEAYALLKELLLTNTFHDYHPEINLLLARFSLEEKSYVQAEFYLKEIIEKFPKSKEKKEALTALVESYILAGRYLDAMETARSVYKSRTKRELKLDARYYELYCHLMLEQYDVMKPKLKKLLKKESRHIKRGEVLLLEARMIAGLGQYDQAIFRLEKLIKDYRKNHITAEAEYRLGELYFYHINDYEKAVEHFNKVKTEDKNSEYYDDSLTKSAIAGQISQFKNQDSSLSIAETIEQSFKLAEHYYSNLNMPDSALVVYENIDRQYDLLQAKKDTLISYIDSLKIVYETDDLPIYFAQRKSVLTDTIPENDVEIDSLFLAKEIEYSNKSAQLETLTQDLESYKTTFLPFNNYLKLWVTKKILQADSLAIPILETMIEQYPDHAYTFAASKLFLGEKPELITIREQNEKKDYYEALRIYKKNPTAALTLLDSMLPAMNSEYHKKGNLLAGRIQYFILQDSTSAKPYFDELIADNDAYSMHVKKFYNGQFLFRNRLSYLVEKEQALQDSMNAQESVQDSTNIFSEEIEQEEIEKTESDTLLISPLDTNPKKPVLERNQNDGKE